MGHEGAHPTLTTEVFQGEATFDWYEDQGCLVQRILFDHPDIADALVVNAVLEGEQTMHYFDSRGVHLEFRVEITEEAWRFWNDSQRWTGVFADDGKAIHGYYERCLDGGPWEKEFEVNYRRA